MSKLDELIAELCPDGVEYKTLDMVCSVCTGTQLNKNRLLDEGDFPVINGGINPSGYWHQYNTPANTIAIRQGGAAGYVSYIKVPFWAGAHCYIVKQKNKNINYKYLYYFLKNIEVNLKQCREGVTIPGLTKKAIYQNKIPIPPLEVQNEIVRILDNFTELTAELTAELTSRKKQFEYYRNALLNQKKIITNDYKLCDVAKIKNGKDYKHLTEGEYPVYGSGGIMNYVSDFAYNKPSVLIPRKGSLSNIYYVDEPFWNVDTIFYTQIDESKVCPKYFYHLLTNMHLENLNKAGGVPSLTQSILNKIDLRLPDLTTQEKIVYTLDNFEKICNDLNIGLPAEIDARQKQYEYYRDTLLSFAETGKLPQVDNERERERESN